jgi:4-hydroxythreonine-4-phosphate dehydrogenase
VARLAILADDLTAAASCALPGLRLGARATIRLAGADRHPLHGLDVVAWDLDTRELAGAGAAARIRSAAGRPGTGDTLYLNIGSRPRRHVGSAVDAALAGSARRVAIVATAAGTDVVGCLRATSRARIVPVGLTALHNGGLAHALDSRSPVILACDATTDEDLEQIVAAGARLSEPPVWVGSAALAAPLSTSVLGSPATPTPAHQRRSGPVLIVLGSLPRPIEVQLSALRSVLRVVPVEVDALALAHGGARAGRVMDDAATAVVRALTVGADTALFAGGSAPTLGGLSARIAAGLAGVARRALSEARAGGIVLTGGHTARAVCDALAIARIDLVGEVEPDVALGRAVDTALDVVAKAGTFGDRLSLVRALGRTAA